MKKYQSIVAMAAVALTAFIGGQTLAYFTDTADVTNTFTVGKLDIDEKEPDWDDGTDGKDMTPGTVVYKNPTVKNLGEANKDPGYVRLRVTLQDADGKTITDADRAALIWKTLRYDDTYTGTYSQGGTATGLVQGTTDLASIKEASITLPMVNPDFTLDAAQSTDFVKVFEYKDILKGQEEATLFTTVVIPSDWKSAEMEKLGSYKVVVKAEAIQSTGFADKTAAFAALNQELNAASGH